MQGQPKETLYLSGYSKKIISKKSDKMIFLFEDERYGDIVCTVRKDLGIYYELKFDKKYQFEGHLQGIYLQNAQGKQVSGNGIIIKRMLLEQQEGGK